MSELKKKRAEQVQNALDTTLSGIQDDPWLAQHVIHGIQKRKKKQRKFQCLLSVHSFWRYLQQQH